MAAELCITLWFFVSAIAAHPRNAYRQVTAETSATASVAVVNTIFDPSATDISAPSSAVASVIAAASLAPYIAPASDRVITQWLAIGDSYSAGIGSDNGPDYIRSSYDCSRYNKAYPRQMQLSPNMPGDANTRILTFGSCSGATTKDVLDRQLKQGDPRNVEYTPIGKPQLATVSMGGNDIGFADIIDACIYKILHPGTDNCREVLDGAWTKIRDQAGDNSLYTDFLEAMIAIVEAGREAEGASPKESFQLFVTGYTQFWNDQDTGCDTVSWSSGLAHWYGYYAYLTTDLRQELNQMVDELNTLIQKVANTMANRGVIYVDGWQVKYAGHRFCEPGTQQELEKPITDNTWFWHWNSPWENGPAGPGVPPVPSKTVNLTDYIYTTLIPPVTGKAIADQIVNAGGNLSVLNPAFETWDGMIAALETAAAAEYSDNSSTTFPLPELVRRVFHPKSFGYVDESQAVIDAIVDSQTAQGPPIPANFTRDGGVVQCLATHDDGNLTYYFSLEDGTAAAQQFCQDGANAVTILGPGGTDLYEVAINGLDISASWNGGSCSKGDFTQGGYVTTCELALNDPLNDCDTVKRTSNDWKQGGSFTKDCITWRISRPGNEIIFGRGEVK